MSRIKHWHQNPPRVPAVCDFCGLPWMARQSSLKGHRRHYCSTACQRLGRMTDLLIDGGVMPASAQVVPELENS
jgi:hypothetical protein